MESEKIPFDHINIYAAPTNGRIRRLVSAKVGETELHRDTINTNNANERRHFLKVLAERIGRPIEEVIARWDIELAKLGDQADQAADETARKQLDNQNHAAAPVLVESERSLAATPADIRNEAEELLRSPELLYRIAEDISALGIVGERELALLVYITMTSRLLDRPIYLLVQGPSSSGKTYITERVCELCPPEALEQVTDMTTNALYYLPARALEHKCLLLGERKRQVNPEGVDATKALRELVESQRLTKSVPIKLGERLQTVKLSITGPVAVIETTSHDLISDEDRNRAIIMATDETQEQTQRILELQARLAAGEDEHDTERIIAVHHTLQRLLKPAEVIVPWATALAQAFPAKRIETRRAFNRVLAVVKALALLRQFQPGRERDEKGRLIATLDDYNIARQLLRSWAQTELGGGVSDAAARLFEKVKEGFSGQVFNRKQCEDLMGLSKRSINKLLRELVEAGLLQADYIHGGSASYRVVPSATLEQVNPLPPQDDLVLAHRSHLKANDASLIEANTYDG